MTVMSHDRVPLAVRAVQVLTVLTLTAYAVLVVVRPGQMSLALDVLYHAPLVGGVVLCLARVTLRSDDRAAWACLAAALAAWTGGALVWALLLRDEPGVL